MRIPTLTAALLLSLTLPLQSGFGAPPPSGKNCKDCRLEGAGPDTGNSRSVVSNPLQLLNNDAEVKRVFAQFNMDSDPLAFKRLIHLIHVLGKDARTPLQLTGADLQRIFVAQGGKIFEEDPIFTTLFDGVKTVTIQPPSNQTVSARLETTSGRDILIPYTGDAHGVTFRNDLRIKDGSAIRIRTAEPAKARQFLEQDDGILVRLFGGMAGAKELLEERDRYMVQAKKDIDAHLAQTRATGLAPIETRISGISIISDGNEFIVEQALSVPGARVNADFLPSWLMSKDSPVFFKAAIKKGPIKTGVLVPGEE